MDHPDSPEVIIFDGGIVIVAGCVFRVTFDTLELGIERVNALLESFRSQIDAFEARVPDPEIHDLPEPNVRRGRSNDSMPRFHGQTHKDRRNALRGHPLRRKPADLRFRFSGPAGSRP